MYTTQVIALFVAGIVVLLLGFLVLSKDWHQRVLLWFQLFCVAVAMWAFGVAQFLITREPAAALVWANVYYTSALAIGVVIQIFSTEWVETKRSGRYLWPLVVLFLVYASCLIAKPHLILRDVYLVGDTKGVGFNGLGYGLFSFVFLALFVSAIFRMWAALRKFDALERSQTRLMVAGLASAGSFGVLFNLILPWFGNYKLIWLGPLFSVLFVGCIGYAIKRHQLFDIRLVVARSLGYILSLVALASIYGFIIFGVAKFGFGLHISVLLQAVLSGGAALAALAFHGIKQWFDKLTNRLFYRDAYNPQELYTELNKVLVSSVDIHGLMTRTISILEATLRAEFMFIGLQQGPDNQRFFGKSKMQFTREDIARIRQLTPRIHRTVIALDYITNPKHYEVKKILKQNNVSVLVRLTQDVWHVGEGLGYIVLGPKKSGNPYSKQDLVTLNTVANELIIAIQNTLRFEEIQQFNDTLQARVNDATRKLRQSNQKLHSMDETKDEFISMASHQLRTPLTSVKGYLSMVLEGDAGKINPNQRKMLQQASISAQRMVYIIADLLNVSRLKTGKFIIEDMPVDLSQIVEDEINQLKEIAQSRSLELVYKKPTNFPLIRLDETKIRQVAMNFIDNAIYYTQTGGRIEVSLSETPKSIEYRVVDNGMGVPQDERHHLFTKFYRAKNAQSARPDGTGLGLFMAKKVVIAEGGAIIFTSREGQGSTFGFSFPKSKLAPANPDKPAVNSYK